MSEFEVTEISCAGTTASVRILWMPTVGRGALRLRDQLLWEGARQCRACQTLGYDHANIDAVLEARRLGLDHAPHVGDGLRCQTCSTKA